LAGTGDRPLGITGELKLPLPELDAPKTPGGTTHIGAAIKAIDGKLVCWRRYDFSSRWTGWRWRIRWAPRGSLGDDIEVVRQQDTFVGVISVSDGDSSGLVPWTADFFRRCGWLVESDIDTP